MSPRSYVRRSAGLAAVCAIAAVSCSPAAPPPLITAPAVTATAVAEAPPPPELDLSPVAEPADLFGVLRFGAPIQDLLILRDLVPAHTPIGQILAPGPEGLADMTYGSLATEVDTGLPLDFVMLGDGSTFVASVVLRDLELAKVAGAADFDFRPADDGSIAVLPHRKAKHGGLIMSSKLACGIYPGGDPVRHHLVCAADKPALAGAAQYLARTIGATPTGPGIRFDVPATAMANILADRKPAADTMAEQADSATRLAASWTKAFNADVAGMGMELGATGGGVTLSVETRFRSMTSPLSVMALAAPGGPTPAIFWDVPKDADIALAMPGAPADTLRAALGPTFWTELADGFAEETSRDIADATTVEMRKLFLTGGPLVFAHGPAPARKVTIPAPRPPTDPVKRFVEARTAAGGWSLVGVPEPASRWTAGLHELVRLGKGPSKKKSAQVESTMRTHFDATELPVRATEKLPSGALHLLMHETPNPKYVADEKHHPPAEGPMDTHVFVGGTADATWISIARSEPLARAKLLEALAGGASGIRSRADLQPLQVAPVGGLGFTTLRGALALFADAETTDDLLHAATTQAKLSLLPSGAAEPILLRVATRTEGDPNIHVLHVAATFTLAGALDLIQYLQ